jgi:hypothetical protein
MRALPALATFAALAFLATAPVASAQASRPATSSTVRYVVLWRTEFLERPSPTAPVIAWLDSAQVLVPTEPEQYQTGHARIVVNGRTGWVDNGYIRRVVTVRDVARVHDTVQVVRTAPVTPPKPRPRSVMGQPSGATKKP